MSQNTFEIKGFLETSFLDWPGKVAAVVFLPGCNFRCPFCHNHGLVTAPESFPTLDWPGLKARLSQFKGWIDGVVISGGEPTLSPGLPDLIREIRAAGFQAKLDTNGSRPEIVAALLDEGLLDHVAMDVKSSLDDVPYARAAGRSGWLEPVRRTLSILEQSGLPFTLRTTVVPGLHSEADICRLAGQLAFAPEWNLQAFSPENPLDPALKSVAPWDEKRFDELTGKALALKNAVARSGKAEPARSGPNKEAAEWRDSAAW